jgi:RHS repeat-associated protein
MGGQYEIKDGATKKYYSIAGMTVAVNDGTGLQYLLTDHLGSTVAVTNSSGTLTSQQRYLPFGGARTIPNSPILATDFGYTGQRLLDSGMGGIMDYKARFYSPYINRFLQPDTIIPDQFNPQSWNRFSYVRNNPILFNDPTGHREYCDGDYLGSCKDMASSLVNGSSNSDGGSGNGDGDSDDGDGESPGNELVDDLETGSIDSFLPTCGQEGVYSSRCPGWHFYTTTNMVCPAELQCTEEEMMDYLLRFAYPGQNPANRVSDLSYYSVGHPVPLFRHLPMQFGMGAIQVDTNINDNPFVSKNITRDSHVLYDGVAIRHAYQDTNGNWYVTTYGFGNNEIHTIQGAFGQEIQWSMATINQVQGPKIFDQLDGEMLSYIQDHQ